MWRRILHTPLSWQTFNLQIEQLNSVFSLVCVWIKITFLFCLKDHHITCFHNKDNKNRKSTVPHLGATNHCLNQLPKQRRYARRPFDACWNVIRHTNLCALCKQENVNCRRGCRSVTDVTAGGSASYCIDGHTFSINKLLSFLMHAP